MAPAGPACHGNAPSAGSAGRAADRDRARPSLERSRRWFLPIVLGLSTTLALASAVAYLSVSPAPVIRLEAGATIYFNEACGDCLVYLQDELLPALARDGVQPVTVKDYINDRAARSELTARNDGLAIPFELQSHLATFVVGGTLTILEGHVPASLIDQALAMPPGDRPARVLVYQDSMDGATAYRAWAFEGEVRTYPIATPLSEYFDWFSANVGGPTSSASAIGLLLTVLAAGLFDGLNPCAFAVLLFFVSFLYAIRAPRREVFRMGAVYAYAVFLVYFLIGLGLLRAILVSDDPHLIARFAAGAVIALGGLALIGLVYPRFPAHFGMPAGSWTTIKERILRGSYPSATAAGLLVGLCTFPCSGGIYVAILGLLAARTTFLEGLGYLYLYNVMYILPLLAILGAVSSRPAAHAATRWERAHAKSFKAFLAAGMVGIGVLLLFFSA